MEISPKFYLRDAKADTATSIQLVVNFNNKRFKYGTGLRISPKHWDTSTFRPTNKRSQLSKLDASAKRQLKSLASKLDEISKLVIKRSGYLLEQDIEPLPEHFKEYLDDKISWKSNTVVTDKIVFVDDYYKKYIDEIKNGQITTDNGKRFAPGTIKNYVSCFAQFKEYQSKKRKRFKFNDITIDLYDKLIEHYNNSNYSPNTIGKHIKVLKTIMRASLEEGLHDSKEFQRRKFKAIKVDSHEIYLNEQEIRSLYDLDLKHNQKFELARDIFLVGVYTGQRYSDYSRITEENIKTTSSGTRIIKLIQKKTDTEVQIPIRPELEDILSRYNYNLPKSHAQNVNQMIKLVGRMAGIDSIEQIEQIRGGKKVLISKPKYQLIKTHSGRRSALTNMYLAGIPPIAIQKLSGHRTEVSLLKYIKVTREENADILAKHHYFMQPLKAVK